MIEALAASSANLLGTHMRNKAAKKASARQMAFQREMSNTSYQRGMEDMRKAGLNPILAGKVGGASTPTGSTYNPENVATNATNAYLQTRQNEANVNLTDANTAKVKAETNVLENSQGSFMGRNVEFVKKEANKVISSVKEKSIIDQALDKIKATLNKAKTKQIMKKIKKSGSKTSYKGKKVYPDRIMRMK